ncbi:hypothetical protein Bca52824_066832 [Brassica carinata]|uniref:Uncharacterized protein n=1 Tax=Brassica carinata TaxID=52824 RepID=A0A8X7QMK3_BRACI|nr:hypothetical protein Bca52824_066832 [Brassica carinata]
MIWGRGVFIGDTSQSASGWWQPCVPRNRARNAAAPRAPHVRLHVQDTCRTPPLLPHVRMHAWSAYKKPHQYKLVDQHASVACAETPRAWSIHLMLPHVRLHVLLPCTATPRDSADTQSRIFFRSRSDALNIFNILQMNSDIL